jgi:hypothetical protein
MNCQYLIPLRRTPAGMACPLSPPELPQPPSHDSSVHLACRAATRKKIRSARQRSLRGRGRSGRIPVSVLAFAPCPSRSGQPGGHGRSPQRRKEPRVGAGRFAPCLARRRKGTISAGRLRLRQGRLEASGYARICAADRVSRATPIMPASFLLSRSVLRSLVTSVHSCLLSSTIVYRTLATHFSVPPL